jgi:hypothetical protein
MIHMLQVLCGPARHCIMAVMYDHAVISHQDAEDGVRALMEMQLDHGVINKRCEICDKKIKEFVYERGISKEQDWDKARDYAKQLEVEQRLTRQAVMAERKAGKN